MRRSCFRRALGAALAGLLLSALLCAPALARVVSAGDDFYYLDRANVLSEALEGEIFFSNQLLYEACGAQVVVVALDTTGSAAIDDYAYDLFNGWGIGDKVKQNGFLLLLAIDDEDYYALCGAGLRSRFSSGTLKDYYDRYLEEDFAAGRYEAGVKRFFEAVFERVADTYGANVTVQQGVAAYERYKSSADAANTGFGGYSGGSGRTGGLRRLVTLALIVFAVIALLRRIRRGRGSQASGGYQRPNPGFTVGSGRSNFMSAYIASQVFKGLFSGRSHRGGWSAFGGSSRPGGSSRSGSGWSSSRPSGGSSRSSGFGGARGGGGGTRGGGAGRGRR